MFRTSTLLPFGLLVIAAGCPAIKGPPAPLPDCTDDALLASISLTVVDDAGNPIPDAVATFSVDGGEEQDCEDFGDGSLQCGVEEAGEFAVSIRADGYSDDEFTQSVEADACHVLTEHIERTLTPADCVTEEAPSIEVTVTDGQLAEVTSGDVLWNMADEDDAPEPCDHAGGNVWRCGWEVAGDLVVEIDNAGPYHPFAEVVTVSTDECGVLTESLSAVLQYLDD